VAKTSLIKFDQAGNIQIDHTGFTGKACTKMTDELMAGIGAEIKKDVKKPEYNMVERNTTGNRLTTGR
jgi:hypothetical protein